MYDLINTLLHEMSDKDKLTVPPTLEIGNEAVEMADLQNVASVLSIPPQNICRPTFNYDSR